MSLEAMVWALKKAPIPEKEPIAQLVLIGLADHADSDGRGARPSVATLATYARCSPRTVHNKLRVLEEAGLIARGDQRAVAHLRADRRPVVYDLAINGVQDMQAVDGHGVNATTSRGEQWGTHGVNAAADRTVHEPSMNQEGEEQRKNSPQAQPQALSEINPERCQNHQGATVVPPCGACRDARINHERTLLRTKAEREQAERDRKIAEANARKEAARAAARAIELCTICDENGYNGLTVCSHDPEGDAKAAAAAKQWAEKINQLITQKN